MAESRRFPPPRAHSPRFPAAPSVGSDDPADNSTNYLAEIDDVVVTSPSDRDALMWDDASGTWINSPIAEADVTGLVSDLALKAPLASPALTGVPTAPTGTPLDSTTQIATQEYVDDAVAASAGGVASLDAIPDVNAPSPSDQDVLTWDDGAGEWIAQAPSAAGSFVLDDATDAVITTPSDREALVYDNGTSKWINDALAISDVSGLASALASIPSLPVDESDVTGLVSDLAAKAPLASPALTGSPTAPTASALDNSTKIATTAYVDAAVTAGGGGSPAARGDVVITTASLADDAEESSAKTSFGSKTSMLTSIAADRACRVRFYTTAAARDADLSRDTATDPDAGVGVLAEYIFTTAETLGAEPAIFLKNGDGTVVDTIYYNIQNLSGGTSAVEVTCTVLPLET